MTAQYVGGPPLKKKRRRIRLEHPTPVTVRLGETGFGSTVIDGIDVSSLTYAVEIRSEVNQPTQLIMKMHGIPVDVEVLGIVEIESDEVMS